MWILPKQLHTSASVAVTAVSDSDLNEFCQTCEKSLMWRSKPSLLRTWLRRWKQKNFLQHLSIRMLKPSRINAFLGAWIYSAVDFHANHLAPQELEKVLKTLVTSTPTSVKESENVNQELFSLKMLKESSVVKPQTENQFSSMSSATWKKWVTEQRQEYSQRLKLAHHTRENESSSWATPITGDAHLASNPEVAQKRLAEGKSTLSRQMAAQNWATPLANDAKGSDYGYSNGKRVDYLGGQAKNWATPNTMDTLPPRSPEKLAEAKKKGGCKNLREEVMNYPTPRTSDAEGGRIETFVEDGTFKSKRHKSNQTFGAKLRDAIETFPTPMVRDHKDTEGMKDRPGHATLPRVLFQSIQADQTNPNTNGNKLELNPNWVEQLMGLPVGWTDLGSWGTESYQTQQQ